MKHETGISNLLTTYEVITMVGCYEDNVYKIRVEPEIYFQ